MSNSGTIALMRQLIKGLFVIVSISSAQRVDSDLPARIARAERRMPWLWSAAAEGLADIPYTYRVEMTRRILNHGKESPPAPGGGGLANWRALQLERIPLDWGSYMRCLSQDGKSPCSTEWVQELERETQHRDALTAADRQRIDKTREERRLRRWAFWDDFPSALRLDAAEVNQLRYSSGGKQSREGLVTAISGRLTFDPSTYEIMHMEYNLTRDVDEPFLRRAKGSHFEIDLAKGADRHYFPSRIFERRRIGKSGEVEELTTVFSNFQKFESESKIQFADPKQ